MMTANPMPCAKCGQVHARCSGHRQQSRGGGPCMQWPKRGQRVCYMHGGNSPKALAKAETVLSEQKARASVEKLDLRRDIHPNDALLEEVYRSAGVVAWLDEVVRGLDADAMVWGVTEQVDKQAGEHPGTDTTSAAELNVWIRFWQQERDRLVKASKAALDANIDERRVQLAESQGALVADVIERIASSVLAALVDAGLPERFAETFRSALREVAPRELRALASGNGEQA